MLINSAKTEIIDNSKGHQKKKAAANMSRFTFCMTQGMSTFNVQHPTILMQQNQAVTEPTVSA